MKSYVILFSGAGSTMKAILEQVPKDVGQCSAAITDNHSALGLKIAEEYSVTPHILPHGKDNCFIRLDELLTSLNPDLIILAGFMKILPPNIVDKFFGKIINIHPSLLPKHKGLNTYTKAIENNDSAHGSTVHFVNSFMDEGPIIAQVEIQVLPNYTAQVLEDKTKLQEQWFYPMVIIWALQERVLLENQKVILDGLTLPNTGIKYPARNN